MILKSWLKSVACCYCLCDDISGESNGKQQQYTMIYDEFTMEQVCFCFLMMALLIIFL